MRLARRLRRWRRPTAHQPAWSVFRRRRRQRALRAVAAASAAALVVGLGLIIRVGLSQPVHRLGGVPVTYVPDTPAAPSTALPGSVPMTFVGTTAPLAPPPPPRPRHCTGQPCSLTPESLIIPDIGVDAFVEQVGLTRDGDVDVPKQWDDAAWFNRGYYPGSRGNAVILGHLDTDSRSQPQAVFWNLHRLRAGGRVQVVRGDGSVLNFVISSVTAYPVDGFPLSTVFGPADHPILRLLTCAGRFRGVGPGYDSRTVVTADLV